MPLILAHIREQALFARGGYPWRRSIYLDEDTARKLKAVAKASGLSQSKWVAKVIRERVCDVWPPQLAALAGTWPDIPDAEDLRQELG